MPFHLLVAFALVWFVTPQSSAPHDPAEIVARLERAAGAADAAAIRALGRNDTAVAELVASLASQKPTRVVVKERDRTELASGDHRLLIETFSQFDREARVVTFNIDVTRSADGWKVSSASRLAYASGLFHLELNRVRQYDLRNLTVEATDFALHVPSGVAFVAETPEGPTAIVLLGAGEMRFTPPDPAERTQVRIFSGQESIRTRFNAAFIRVRPSDFGLRFPAASMVPRPAVSADDLRRADEVFEEYIGKTLHIDLADLSRERWSITPQFGDLIAEIRTNKLGSLTYTRSTQDQEDVTLFDRRRRKNISVYASAEKLARRGRFYSEDDLLDYDVVGYDIDAAVNPDRSLIEGTARLKVKVRANGLSTLNLRLAESLTVRGVYSPEFGRLLHLRVVGQNSLIVNLPVTAAQGSALMLLVLYSGRVQPQELDREAIALSQDVDAIVIAPEPRYLYSHRAYWYPQSTVSDYATARLSITVPEDYDVVATGSPSGEPGRPPGVSVPGQKARRLFVFEASRPVRYLALVISRLRPVTARKIDDVTFTMVANARQTGRARGMGGRTEDIFRYYTSLVGRAPYPTFTVAFTEREVPGGHSPAYFAVVDQVMVLSSITWRNDPVNFEGYPAFFVAHEVAHQWWGQAVGWKNYHEQWISEGFAQYFAWLYAAEKLGGSVAGNVMRQMRQTAIAQSDEGPVYLGYRLGHIKNQTPVFRSVVYNKAAMVLHMLRRIVGDEAFFRGIRDFYAASEFQKAGTDDFQAAMEQASGKRLDRFFRAWIFGQSIPSVKFAHRVEQQQAVVRFEQRGDPVDIPITVTFTFASGETMSVVVPVTEQVVEQRIQLIGALRSVEVNADHAALAVIAR